jgi:hypothetical protein
MIKTCTRCGRRTDVLIHHEIENQFGELVKMDVCWDCDFDIINNRCDPFDSSDDLEEEEELW